MNANSSEASAAGSAGGGGRRYRSSIDGAGGDGGYRSSIDGAGGGGGYRSSIDGAGGGGGYRSSIDGAGSGGTYRSLSTDDADGVSASGTAQMDWRSSTVLREAGNNRIKQDEDDVIEDKDDKTQQLESIYATISI